MSTTDTGTDTGTEEPPPGEPAALPPGPSPVRDRLLLPLLLPVHVIAIVVVVAINISRVLLASDSNIALVVGIVLTVGILGGAAVISASPRMRGSSLAWILGGTLFVVMAAGLITLGASQEHGQEAAGYEEPQGEPVAKLPVHALPTNV
ncbi:MAG: hypothetical protein ACRDWD_02905, partial [Acidimicrobiia bacterium]